MNLKQMLSSDLNDIYNIDEFATSVLYKGNTIPALYVEDMEISDSEQFVLSFVSSDVLDVEVGDGMTVDEVDYQVINFDFKDKYKQETLIALNKV